MRLQMIVVVALLGCFSSVLAAENPPLAVAVPLDKIAPIGASCREPGNQPRCTDLAAFFRDANPILFKWIDGLHRKVSSGESHFGVTHVAGMPGVGKSFLCRHLSKYAPSAIYVIPLEKLPDKIPMPLRGDLDEIDDRGLPPLSKLPAFEKPASAPDIPQLLRAFGYRRSPSFVILDSIGEIHPLSAKALLIEVDAFVRREKDRNPQGFLHVFIVGRPEGFIDYYRDPKIVRLAQMYELHPPRYRSMADLEVAIESSRRYFKLSEEHRTASLRLAAKHPFVCESAHILAALGYVVQLAPSLEKESASERDIKEKLFTRLLERNSKVHRFFDKNGGYVRLLELVACKYANRVSRDGYFVVGDEDVVEIEATNNDGQPVRCRYRCAEILAHSGLTYLYPYDMKQLRFRFVPSWIHEHLVYRQKMRGR
ncbi:MAG: hypothetical protein KatS3mg105_3964 [Gemmatales bacterium]|nr:MAG: hypothetical protein KatS3mg105_3964 [Gemmatales bacterium]